MSNAGRLMEKASTLLSGTQMPLSSITRPYRKYFPVVALTGLFAGLLEGISVGLLIPFVTLILRDNLPAGAVSRIAVVFPSFATADRPAIIFLIGGAMIALIILKGLVQTTNNVLITSIDGRIARDIRDRLSDKMLGLDYAAFLTNSKSRFAQIIVNESWYASEALRALLTIVPAAIALAVFGLMLIWLDWRLSALAVCGAALIQSALLFVERRQRRLGFEVTSSNQRLWKRMFGITSAIRTIRIFGQTEREQRQFESASEDVRKSLFRIMRGTVSVVPLVEVLISILFVAIVLTGYRLGDSVPQLTAFLVLLARGQPYAHVIGRSRVEYASYAGSLSEVEWLLAQKKEAVAGERSIVSINKAIRFDNVSFRYPDGVSALGDVNLTIQAGVSTALIGKSGAGKSTLVDLLARLIEPQSGTIYHGDDPIRSFEVTGWRSRMAIAGQNVDLLDGSIAENILYGRREASDDEIKAAAIAAGASKFIDALPQGYQTHVGTEGLELAGGERQRIGLARALLRDPDLLILDEATSAVDALSEDEIFSLLKESRRSRTTLIISHRRSTLALCDEGIVLDGGEVIETGQLRSLPYFETMVGAAP